MSVHIAVIIAPPFVLEVHSPVPYLSLPAAERGALRERPARRHLLENDRGWMADHSDPGEFLARAGHDPRPAAGDAVRDPDREEAARKRERRASTRHTNRGARGKRRKRKRDSA